MSVKRRLTGYSGMRVDWPHIRSMQSAVSFDFDSVLRGMVTGLDSPYLIRGFEIQIPDAAVAANSLQVEVSDTAILHSTAGESGTIFTIPAGTAADALNSSNDKVIGAFQNGVPNYVSVELVRVTDPDSTDQTAGWSQAQQTEFQRTVPIGSILQYRYIITTSGFSTNLPLYIIGVSSTGAVEYIQNSRTNLFRLGRGGTSPDPFFNFDFGNLSNNQNPLNPRQEWVNENPGVNPNPVTAVPGDDPSAFRYGDFSITSMKDWMDAIMTRLKEVTGSSYWYTDSALSGSSINTLDLWWDSIGSVMTGSGNISYNLILEINDLTSGALQTSVNDSAILPGDSFIEGAVSGNRATLQTFNNTQLVINSLTREDFIFDEVLRNRRLLRPNLAIFGLVSEDDTVNSEKVAIFKRLSTVTNPSVSVSSWSYTGNLVTITTSAAHGYEVGDNALIENLEYSAGGPNLLPNGVHLVKNVLSATEFQFTAQFEPNGTPAAAIGSTSKDGSEHHPYLPRFALSSWEIDGSDVLLTVPGHSFNTGDDLVISGLTAASDAPNGRYLSITVESDRRIRITPAVLPGAPVLNGNEICRYDRYDFLLTVDGSSPDTYEVIDVTATAWSDTQLSYTIGPDSLPVIPDASGAIILNGVIATSTVANPVKISSVVNDGAGNLTVTTTAPHGLSSNPGPITYTIYGDQSISPYIRTYENVSISINSPTEFEITPIAPNGTVILPPPSSYVNSSNDDTYARFPDNPYPGPIQWSDDIVTKGIVGDRFFRVTADATATGTATANRFNVNGLTGTAFLQDGEVAYIELERNGEVSNGAIYSSTGGDTITGTEPPKDEDGNFLVAGDFIKFESDSEAQWIRIAGTFGTEITGNVIPLISDNGQPPSLGQRPNTTGRLIYAKTSYDQVIVKPHWQVTPSPDVYWLAVRRDNNGSSSKVYFRGLELEEGEVRQINDNELSNHLIYTGARTEAAVNPNYTVIDASGVYGPTQTLTVGSDPENIDTRTRQITFVEGPELGFEAEDKITFLDGGSPVTYTINFLISSRTVVVKEDISALTLGQDVEYIRDNYKIQDSDNLTLAIRKSDRESARINTALERPVYDESVYPQLIPVRGTGTIKSGGYIYQGDVNNPTALAWVLHGTDTTTETIEGFSQSMPGGHPSIGNDAIIAVIYSGSWTDGSTILQDGSAISRTIDNPGDPDFESPELVGGTSGIEIVLPPNRRTEVKGSAIVVWPAHSVYKASLADGLAGEELMVIANDTIREANLDYEETFGGPKAKIKITRTLPPNSRLRFRVMAAFGSALAKLAGNVTLQLAYDGGRIISSVSGLPVDFRAGDAGTGGSALNLRGSLEINGEGSTPGTVPGGIFGPRTPVNKDQSFVIGRENNKPKEIWTGVEYIKTHSGYTGSAWTRKTGSGVSTGDAGDIISNTAITVPAGKSARISINATANKTGGLGVASFKIEGTFYNTGAGAQIAGSPASYHLGGAGDGDLYAVAFGVTGDDVVLVAYGSDGSTVQWVAGIDYQIMETSV